MATNCEYLQVLSKTVNTPFYVVGESFKFVRMYPLSQWDVPQEQSKPLPSVPVDQYHSINPMLDYTPPSYINLLFTDLGTCVIWCEL